MVTKKMVTKKEKELKDIKRLIKIAERKKSDKLGDLLPKKLKLESSIERSKKIKEFNKKFDKFSKGRIKARRILKPSQMSLEIKEQEVPSVLGDTNRFIKGELIGGSNEKLFFR